MIPFRPKAQSGSQRSGRARGFTMIEVLLAIGIFGLVMTAIYSSWSAILRGTRVGLTAAAEVQRTRVAVRALEESLGAAVMYADNPIYYSFFADTTGNYAYLSFVARLPESFPGSGLFPGQPLRRVTFHVDGEGTLLLSQSTLLDISEQPYTIKLAPKTSVFAAEFYNPRMNEWIPEWISTNQLPTIVRVALNFGEVRPGVSGNQAVTIRTIPLTATAITRVAAAGQPGAPGGPGGGGGGAGGRGGGPDARGGGVVGGDVMMGPGVGGVGGRGGAGGRAGAGPGLQPGIQPGRGPGGGRAGNPPPGFGGGSFGSGGVRLNDGPVWMPPRSLPPGFGQTPGLVTPNPVFPR